jgi:uncharacterized protein YoxC
MFDLLLKLIDKIIQFGQTRKTQNRDLYSDFVVPIIKDFEVVHSNYIETYKKYIRMIEENSETVDLDNNLFNEIRRDSIYSGDIRNKLNSLNAFFEVKRIGEFCKSINQYLDTNTDKSDYNTYNNAARYDLVTSLELILVYNKSCTDKKEKGIKYIERSIMELQDKYKKVISEGMILKKQLLL